MCMPRTSSWLLEEDGARVMGLGLRKPWGLEMLGDWCRSVVHSPGTLACKASRHYPPAVLPRRCGDLHAAMRNGERNEEEVQVGDGVDVCTVSNACYRRSCPSPITAILRPYMSLSRSTTHQSDTTLSIIMISGRPASLPIAPSPRSPFSPTFLPCRVRLAGLLISAGWLHKRAFCKSTDLDAFVFM